MFTAAAVGVLVFGNSHFFHMLEFVQGFVDCSFATPTFSNSDPDCQKDKKQLSPPSTPAQIIEEVDRKKKGKKKS